MSISFVESGMSFGPYAEDEIFPIEKSPLYKDLGQGLMIAEFVLIRPGVNGSEEVWVIEAKSSAPKSFANYIEEIRQKLTNSVQLTLASCLRRHQQAAELLPARFLRLDLGACTFKCILVINGFRKDWLPPLQSALAKEMNSLVKTMGLKPGSVSVINDDKARELKLIH
ncbi:MULTISPECIES: hypothetical protein [unclassified Pseudomonas]|uniref:hypothetical protein n=1 Tax=unclassified Pseudomonas TaxID=196821 RepID=UPI0011997A64|nr:MULTISPECIES: hypothetical protein [unclassified Pseudomonas]TWC06693.1 hypothetical protein FBY00_1498 [Pseudomonas sp. SJZ075]TWC20905.1 hypothetical protein FBX99_10875 [Pseudomonas sp. SJZ074]TWC26832.1 hypothetical protein FBY02_1438 [Pseudomonas sp. SJZ078]TWC38432.1 hypothetical protein FBY06_10988 [Pseudomonas sp. SJZ085]TWC45478.1 hypothetical protein FBY11_1508 [Pseudomonas sp. SJZ124]